MGEIVKGLALSAIASSVVMAGGYKIPEQSLNSMALAAAYVAHTTGADTAYFNPANMSFMNAEKRYVEGGITLAHLPSNVYTLMDPYSGESEVEDLLIPFFHYVSKPIGDFRWGVSMTAPGGLTKGWETPFQKLTAEEFTLRIVELNPSLSYKIADNFSIGGGIRLIYSEGIVKSNGAEFSAIVGNPMANIARDMEGDTIEFGYNLALAYKPTNDINMAVTYRSNIDLDQEGTALLSAGGNTVYNGDASVSVPLPAALNIAISKTWNDKFTLEFNYERTYWSAYETLDFEYGGANIGPLTPVFDTPIARDWQDTNTFRLGATIELDKITMMMGFAIDETPVPVETLGFELPDSDAKIFSMGFRYQQTEELSWGAAFLYDSKEPLTIAPGVNDGIPQGGFSEGGAYLTTVGIAYEF
ncbi:OmpP1/FadL family transporter [Sulfurovum sp. CS9]|uniref:OmpP1/FadL family transporter n=1 Tax=Sulfurovum sp. CS9 TaxID=3391146 RepID=UPI0039E7CC77